MEDITRILSHKDTTLQVKSAYTDFLSHVYADAEIEMEPKETSLSNFVWTIFESFANDFTEVFSKNFDDSVKEKTGLFFLTNKNKKKKSI